MPFNTECLDLVRVVQNKVLKLASLYIKPNTHMFIPSQCTLLRHLRSPFFVKSLRHCVLSGATQFYTINFVISLEWESNTQPSRLPHCHDVLQSTTAHKLINQNKRTLYKFRLKSTISTEPPCSNYYIIHTGLLRNLNATRNDLPSLGLFSE